MLTHLVRLTHAEEQRHFLIDAPTMAEGLEDAQALVQMVRQMIGEAWVYGVHPIEHCPCCGGAVEMTLDARGTPQYTALEN